MTQFKAGDWIRRINSDNCPSQPIGTIVQITSFDGEGAYFKVVGGGEDYWFSDNFEIAVQEPERPGVPADLLLEDAIPVLAGQMQELVTRFNGAVQVLKNNLDNENFVNEVIGLAASRTVTGFEEYGAQMWSYDKATLARNAKEEVADFLVYIARYLRITEQEIEAKPPSWKIDTAALSGAEIS